MKSSWPSIIILSLIFTGAYFMLRALPDAQCGFLHYEEVVNVDGEIELCATNHAGFLDLSKLSYPVVADLRAQNTLYPGVYTDVELHLETSGGMTIAPHELAITHTEKMHVMLIDPSLEDYQHIHPRSDGFDGIYRFSLIPKRSGNYRVFTEIVPIRSRRQAVAVSELEVSGAHQMVKFDRASECLVDGLLFKLNGAPKKLKTGRDYLLQLNISRVDGAPIKLETVMGAKGHMVAFDAEIKGFAHMHPVDSILSSRIAGLPGVNNKPSDLSFIFNVPNSGWYRLFAQIQLDSKAIFGRFDLYVD